LLLVAVSANGDPTGAWSRYELEIDTADFTRLAITRNTILLGTLMDTGAILFSFNKAQLYAGANNVDAKALGASESSMPVHHPEVAAEYFVTARQNNLYVSRLDTNQAFSNYAGFNYEDGWNMTAPQRGHGLRLELGYGEIESAVLRNGWIYAVQRIGEADNVSDANALLLWKVDANGTRPGTTLVIDSPAGQFYAYPSLAVNARGDVLIGFSTFSSATYPSAAYIAIDAAGRVSPVAKLQDGDSPTFVSERWGDYSTTSVDPLNDRDFWTGQIVSQNAHWATWWAQVKAPAGTSKRRSVRRR
jgi:hypothetical protein